MKTLTLFTLLVIASAAFAQKIVYSLHFYNAAISEQCRGMVKFGPELKIRTDDPCAKKEGWVLYDYHTPAKGYYISTEMKKLVYTTSPHRRSGSEP